MFSNKKNRPLPPAEQRRLTALFSLLDDEDEAVAVTAMGELLDREDDLGDLPAIVQETASPLARRRIHQLQAAITLRRRRRNFMTWLDHSDGDLIDGLIEVHLQWFDNDSRPGLVELWQKFADRAAAHCWSSLQDAAGFFRREKFRAYAESTTHPESYCVGTVIEDRQGATSLLAAVTLALLSPAPSAVVPVRILGEFGIYDGHSSLLLPGRDWLVTPCPAQSQYEVWDNRQLLRFAAFSLFSAAVNSDSFRYVFTIAQALNRGDDMAAFDFLPYPYYPTDDEKK